MGFPPGRIIEDDPLGMRCAAAAVCRSVIPFLAAGVMIFILLCVCNGRPARKVGPPVCGTVRCDMCGPPAPDGGVAPPLSRGSSALTRPVETAGGGRSGGSPDGVSGS